jgi:predicted porin
MCQLEVFKKLNMNKSFLLLVTLLSISGIVSAQSSATVYGVVDAGVVYENGHSGGSLIKLQSGLESSSRLGIKGKEDLGNGLRALYVLEQGIAIDNGTSTQGGRVFGRQAYVGLSGNFGTVTMGRQYTPIYNAYGVIDPFGNNSAGDINTLFGQDSDFLSRDYRMDNALIYTTPSNLGGFNAALAYSFGEQPGSLSMKRQMGLSLGYASGPINVIYAFHLANNENLEFDADNGSSLIDLGTFKTHFVGGTYNFDVIKVHAAFDQTKQGDDFKTQSYLLGATIPLGIHSVFGDFTYRDNKVIDDANASQIAVGFNYTLSKRTNLYSILAYTNNDDNSKVNTDVSGKTVTRVQLGIRHTF